MGNNSKTNVKKSKYIPWKFKERLPLALLAAFALPFTIVIYGVFEIYASNRAEFDFALTDVWVELLSVFGICFAVLATILLVLRRRAFDIAFATVFWVTVMAYMQGNFLNFGVSSLSGDGVGESTVDVWLMVLNVAIWVAAGVGCFLAVLLVKNREMVHLGAVILLVMIIVMQLINFSVTSLTTDVFKPKSEQTDIVESDAQSESGDAESAGGAGQVNVGGDKTDAESESDKETDKGTQSGGSSSASTEKDSSSSATTSKGDGATTSKGEGATTEADNIGEVELKNLVLTTEDLYTVSSKNNVIIIMVDRFDALYAKKMLAEDPEFFDGLTGFTYYSDNISKYPRTYPAVASMITGIENDFSGTASEYFENAYQNSDFLKLLKDNGYRINIYGSKFYTYRDAKELYGVADNISVSEGYKVVNKATLVKNLISLSSYRYVPLPAKAMYSLSSDSFKGFVQYDVVYPEYIVNDAEFYANLKENGLSVRDDASTYSFICLSGCHPPYHLDANGEYSEEKTSLVEATTGTFKIIYDYLDMLRELGLYENSTIIITGDHANAVSDTKYLDGVRQTAIFFKEKGKSDEPLAYSSAQVSQDNLIPSIVESEGLETDTDFGDCYWDIREGEDRVRKYLLIRSLKDDNGKHADVLVEYKIDGYGGDFNNWSITKETLIGYLYK